MVQQVSKGLLRKFQRDVGLMSNFANITNTVNLRNNLSHGEVPSIIRDIRKIDLCQWHVPCLDSWRIWFHRKELGVDCGGTICRY